jgi:O-antigen/teichoic acid export membrane protein
MLNIFAHGEEITEQIEQTGFLENVTHQSLVFSLFLIAFFLFGVYQILEKVKVKTLNRVIIMMPLLILIAILYLKHNPAVTAVMLALGFGLAFFLAFNMIALQNTRKTKSKEDTDKNEGNSE